MPLQGTPAVAAAARTTFEWGRIDAPVDWLLPLSAAAALVAFTVYMYRRDAVDLRRPVAILLTALRVAAIAAVFVVYLRPQWRNEREVVTPSRAVVMVDTSLSMGLHDSDDSPIPAEPTRAQQVIAALADSRFLDDLRRTHDVLLMGFDRNVARIGRLDKLSPAPPGSPARTPAERAAEFTFTEQLSPHGDETRLGQALRQVLIEEHAEPLSGIVLFTDGQQNAGIEPLSQALLARENEVAVLSVGIGSDRQGVNVRVSDFVAPARAYPGDKYTATGYLQAQGLAGQTVTVELRSSDAAAAGRPADDRASKVVDMRQVTLSGDGEVLPVAFDMVPDAVGRKTLLLRVAPPPGDAYAGDNQQEVDIEIVGRKTKVLLFAGGPTREYQFLRNQLRRDKDMTVDVLLQTGAEGISQDANAILDAFPSTREELYEYDCIVAFDPDWKQLTATQIETLDRWVAEQAGGLIVIAGPIYSDTLAQDASLSKVRSLYPVEFQRRFSVLDDGRYGAKEPWPIAFTRDGTDAEFLSIEDSGPASAHAWSEFKGVYGYYAVKGPKPGATVYARFSDPRAREGDQQPVYSPDSFLARGACFISAAAKCGACAATKRHISSDFTPS